MAALKLSSLAQVRFLESPFRIEIYLKKLSLVTYMSNLTKPKIRMDWDKNRRVVTSVYGQEMVLFKDEAKRVYKANVAVYKKRGR